MHNLGCGRIAGVHAVNAEVGPHRRQACEGLSSRESIPAGDALDFGGGEEHRDVVAAFRVARGEYSALCSLLEKPLERGVTGAPKIRSDTRPVQVHVDRKGGRRCVVTQAPLLMDHLGE